MAIRIKGWRLKKLEPEIKGICLLFIKACVVLPAWYMYFCTPDHENANAEIIFAKVLLCFIVILYSVAIGYLCWLYRTGIKSRAENRYILLEIGEAVKFE